MHGSVDSRNPLDHVGIVGRDLAAMAEAYRALGFALTEPRELLRVDPATGLSQATGQWSCHAVFRQGYLELTSLAIEDPSHHLAPLIAAGGGLRIVVYATGSPAADRERLREAGCAVGPLAQASRRIEYGSRHGEARFEWFSAEPPRPAGRDAAGRGLTAYVRHLTPELVFQPEVMEHPNGARALLDARPCESFTVGVADLAEARRWLQRAQRPCRVVDGGLDVPAEAAGGARLRLVQDPG